MIHDAAHTPRSQATPKALPKVLAPAGPDVMFDMFLRAASAAGQPAWPPGQSAASPCADPVAPASPPLPTHASMRAFIRPSLCVA